RMPCRVPSGPAHDPRARRPPHRRGAGRVAGATGKYHIELVVRHRTDAGRAFGQSLPTVERGSPATEAGSSRARVRATNRRMTMPYKTISELPQAQTDQYSAH